MANITLHVPDDLHRLMRRHKEVRWSEVARKAIISYTGKLQLLDEIASESAMTQRDVMKIDKQIKRGIAKRYGL